MRRTLARSGLKPAPRREGPTRRAFLHPPQGGILACDFFCVDTILPRRVHLAGVTRNPNDGAWVTQQARNLAIGRLLERFSLLIGDRDFEVTHAYDHGLRDGGNSRDPDTSPHARRERVCRALCPHNPPRVPGLTLTRTERHLERIIGEYLEHYNRERPHRRLALRPPDPPPPRNVAGPIERRDRLGGLIHHYERTTA